MNPSTRSLRSLAQLYDLVEGDILPWNYEK